MDLSHVILALVSLAVGVVLGVIAVRGFGDLRARSEDLRARSEKDEAIDAATFLALRQLQEYVRSTRQAPEPPR